MLSVEENELLTRVGPGTPMGQLLRRYWTPACLSVELPEPDGTPLRVELLGERLVAFRDSEGSVGLIGEACPHRGASLYFGRNEECGLRCPYHGWKFDTSGQCVDQPSEVRPFAEQIRATAYPTHESGGIVWAYLGPRSEMTPFRDFGTETLPVENVSASKELLNCNWVQCLDGDLDTSHISNLHQFDAIDDLPDDGTDQPGYPSNYMSMKFWRHDRRPRLEVSDEWYGFRYAGIRTTPKGHTHVRISTYVMPYTAIIANIPYATRQIMVVPINDTRAWRFMFQTHAPSTAAGLGGPPFFTAPGYPYVPFHNTGIVPREYHEGNDYQIDRDAQRNVSFSGIPDFRSQDLMVTESAGPIYDRSLEHLGSGDVAVIRLHQSLLDAARGVGEGRRPPGLEGDFRSIRSAEKILAPGESWQVLGTDDDPIVQVHELSARQSEQA